MLKLLLILSILLASNSAFANPTDTSAVDAYTAAHLQDVSGAAAAGTSLGGAARSNYSNASKFSNQLNAHSSGTGGMLDLAGQAVKSKTTKFDLCVLNNPQNPAACSADRAEADAYKQCQTANPANYQTACAATAGALADINFASGCGVAKQYLKIAYVPGDSGDITALQIFVDATLSGAPTQVDPLPANGASGVCANGIISCNPGTWDNCKYFLWTAAAGIPALQQTTNMSDVGGCYCVNNSCGSNLPFLNGTQILRDFSGGISGALLKTAGEGVQITETRPEGGNLTIRLFGSLLSDCNGSARKAIETNNPAVNRLTGIAQSMTNPNPTDDTLFDAGVNAAASAEIEPDDQGSDISADGFSDPATRAQWKSDYQAHGTNYVKLVKNVDDISGATFQEVKCSIKRNYSVSTTTNSTNDLSSTRARLACTDTTNAVKVTKTGNNYSLYHVGTAKNSCPGGDTLIKSWTDSPTSTGTTTTTTAATATGGIHTGAGSTDLTATASTTVSTTTTTLGTNQTFSAGIKYDCDGGSGAPTVNNLSTIAPANGSWAGVIDGNCSAPKDQTIFGTWHYEMTDTSDVSSEAISDSCQALDINPDCRQGIKDKTIDGIVTMTNFMSTGLNALPSCKQFTGIIGSFTVCRPFWEERRTYQCTNTTPPNTDVDDINKRASSINTSTTFDAATGDIKYGDTAKDASGNLTTTTQTSNLKVSAPGITCDMVCKVSKIETDTQARTAYGSTVNNTAIDPSKPQRTGVGTKPAVLPANAGAAGTEASATKTYSMQYCNPVNPANITAVATDWTCAAQPDETIESPCGCPEDMGEAIGKVSALLEAGKNQKCTTGATVESK